MKSITHVVLLGSSKLLTIVIDDLEHLNQGMKHKSLTMENPAETEEGLQLVHTSMRLDALTAYLKNANFILAALLEEN